MPLPYRHPTVALPSLYRCDTVTGEGIEDITFPTKWNAFEIATIVLYVLLILFMVILLLNLLIAVMGATYAERTANATLQCYCFPFRV